MNKSEKERHYPASLYRLAGQPRIDLRTMLEDAKKIEMNRP